jgi:hypothetical protein
VQLTHQNDEAHRPRGPSDHAGWTNLGGAYGQGEVIEIVDVSHGKEELDGAQARDCKLELPILSPAGIGNVAACHPAALDPVPKAILCPLRMDPDNLEPGEIALDELRPGRVVRRIQAELRNVRVDGFDVRPPLAVVLTSCRRIASNPIRSRRISPPRRHAPHVVRPARWNQKSGRGWPAVAPHSADAEGAHRGASSRSSASRV